MGAGGGAGGVGNPPLPCHEFLGMQPPGPSPAGTPNLERMPRDRLLVLATALLGYLLVNLSSQFVGANLADIGGGLGATADEASWLTAAYTMALLVGVILSGPLIATLGLRRYTAAAASLFALAALGCALAPALPLAIALRVLQGLAAGGFGPIAFAATFMTTAGPRLPFGLSLLALFLLLPASLGQVVSASIEDLFGWQALFLVQAGIGAALAAAAAALMPRAPIALQGLSRDWVALLLLSLALAATLLVLVQGTRFYWFESRIIPASLAVAAAAWAGFLLRFRRSPLPVLDTALLARRSFIGPIALNLMFRAGFATTAFLIPQYLAVVHGYRPLELARLFLWAAIPQLLAFPLVWWLLHRIERRTVAASGLFLFGLAALIATGGSSEVSADQLRLVLLLAGAGQVLFLVPNLAGAGLLLKPADGPTASLMFNATTLGGTSLGVALATELVTERQKLHFARLAEHAGSYAPGGETLNSLASLFAARLGDDALAGSNALAALAAALRREAWTLAFSDGLLVIGALVAAGALGLLLVQPQPPLPRAFAPAAPVQENAAPAPAS